MDYEFDIFISYSSEYKDWVLNIFIPLLKICADNDDEINDIKICKDVDQFQPGYSLSKEIKNHLSMSRILIAVTSKAYFKSGWCKTEWIYFLKRQKRLQELNILKNPIVLPVRISDGNCFPEAAGKLICFNYKTYFCPSSESFKKTADYREFQKELARDWPQISKSVINAPPWDQSWKNEEYFKKAEKLSQTDPRFQLTKGSNKYYGMI